MKSWRGSSGASSWTSRSGRAGASATARSDSAWSVVSRCSRPLAGAPLTLPASDTRSPRTTPHVVLPSARYVAIRTWKLRRAANATLARMTVRARARDLRQCPLAAARARDLTGGARDGTPQGLDRGRGQSRAQARHADRRLGTAVSAEDGTSDAHD